MDRDALLAATPLACPLCAMPAGPGSRGVIRPMVDDSPRYGPAILED